MIAGDVCCTRVYPSDGSSTACKSAVLCVSRSSSWYCREEAVSQCTWVAAHLGILLVDKAGEGSQPEGDIPGEVVAWAVRDKELAAGVDRLGVGFVVAASLTLLGWGCELFLGYVACRGGRTGSSSNTRCRGQ